MSYNQFHEIHCPMTEIFNVKKNLEKKIDNFISTKIEWLPLNVIKIDYKKKNDVVEFINNLLDDDDVQNVFSNVKLEDN